MENEKLRQILDSATAAKTTRKAAPSQIAKGDQNIQVSGASRNLPLLPGISRISGLIAATHSGLI